MADEIHFQGRVEEADYLAAVHLLKLPFLLRMVNSGRSLIPLIFIVGGVHILLTQASRDLFQGVLMVLVGISLLIFLRRVTRAQYRQRWQVFARQFEAVSGVVSEDGLRYEFRGMVAQVPWSIYVGCDQNDAITLPKLTPLHFHILMRNMFASDDDWAGVRRIIARQVEEGPVSSVQPDAMPELPDGDVTFRGEVDLATMSRSAQVGSRWLSWLRLVGLIVAILGLWYMVSLLFQMDSGFLRLPMLALLVLCVTLVLARLYAVRKYTGMLLPHRRVLDGRADDEGLWGLFGDALRQYNWDYFFGYRQAGPLLLLYQNSLYYVLLHREMFQSSADWQTMLDLVVRHVPAYGATHKKEGCAECGRKLPGSQMLRFGDVAVCPDCKDAHVQKLKEGVDS